MDNSSYSFLIDKTKLEEIVSFYKGNSSVPKNDYILFAYKDKNVAISIYKRKNPNEFTILFQGEKARKEALKNGFEVKEEIKRVKKTCPEAPIFSPQIGSDEVGTGDYFGPIIVAASFISNQTYPILKELGVTDSKLLNDKNIKEIGAKLINLVPYSELYLPQEKYNELSKLGLNINQIKAKMHNRVLLNLAKKYPNIPLKQDQFASAPLYYSYLCDEKEIASPIEFKTKGELFFPSVAAASIIARYSFLLKMEKLNKAYDLSFPFGSGNKVDSFGKEFVRKYGEKELEKVAKVNFANTKKILN